MSARAPALLVLAIAAALTGCATTPTATAPTAATTQVAESKGEHLTKLYEAYWEESLKLNPIQATFQGDPRFNDQLPDFYSADYRRQSHEFTHRWLDAVQAVGSEGLDGQDLLSYQIFVRDAKQSLESEQFPTWMLPMALSNSTGTRSARLSPLS